MLQLHNAKIKVVAFAGQNIISHDYDSFEKKLTVYFLGGGKYQIMDVPFEKYEGLLNAKHKQHYYIENLKGKYKEVKIY